MKRLEKFVNWLGNIDFSTKWISLSLAFMLIIGSALFITYDLADMKPTEKSYSELQSVADYMVEHKSFVLPDVNECEDVEKISSYTIQRSTSGDISFSFSHKTTNAGLNLTFDENMKLKTQERRNSTGSLIFAILACTFLVGCLAGFVSTIIVTFIQCTLDKVLCWYEEKSEKKELKKDLKRFKKF